MTEEQANEALDIFRVMCEEHDIVPIYADFQPLDMQEYNINIRLTLETEADADVLMMSTARLERIEERATGLGFHVRKSVHYTLLTAPRESGQTSGSTE